MKTILVVDDYASVRFYHMTLLRTAGYSPLAASSGAEALALLDKHPVDLVMLDLMMPGMSGREVVRRIRAMPNHAARPVLVITSETQHAELDHLKVDPACSVLTKPILPSTLMEEVRRRIG